jgi:peroxidase
VQDAPNGKSWTKLFVAGDHRANENTGLQVLTILFAREHNRKAASLKKSNPAWSDERYGSLLRFLLQYIKD